MASSSWGKRSDLIDVGTFASLKEMGSKGVLDLAMTLGCIFLLVVIIESGIPSLERICHNPLTKRKHESWSASQSFCRRIDEDVESSQASDFQYLKPQNDSQPIRLFGFCVRTPGQHCIIIFTLLSNLNEGEGLKGRSSYDVTSSLCLCR